MRRQHFAWTYLVLATVLTVYGGYTLIYHFRRNDKLSVWSLIFLIVGSIMLLIFLVLFLITMVNKKKQKPVPEVAPQPEPEPVPEPTPEPEPVEEASEEPEEDSDDDQVPPEPYPNNNGVTYERGSYSIYDSDDSDVYVKKVGYGPVLRVTGSRILDMRTNTYYRIQGNYVNQDGSGQVYEISGDRIRAAFGGYLYEISGRNINKTYGGFYASVSGNYITLYDSSEKYETTGSLNKKQLLVVAALLFGTY